MIEKYGIFVVFVVIFASRLLFLGKVPGAINQDEAMAAYQALAMNAEGIDMFGYRNPVYFTAWGSGMSVLPSYIMRITFSLVDNRTVALRLPQAIMSCVSFVVFYLLMKRFVSKEKAVIALILAAVMPWNFMSGRLAIDCYMLPAFLLMGTYFFVLGLEKSKWFVVSALCWGLALYCYVLSWVTIPFILLLYFGYSVKTGKLRFTRENVLWLGVAVVVLALLATPLVLFLLVNNGIIPEIRLSWISIPKLAGMRDSEISLRRMFSGETLVAFLHLLVTQYDSVINNTTVYYGMFYLYSLPILILGFAILIKKMVRAKKQKEFSPGVLVLIPIVVYFVFALMLENVNANKLNGMLWPLTICLIVGVWAITEKVGRYIGASLVGLYLLSFLSFGKFYLTDYREAFMNTYLYGVEEAIHFADTLDVEHIYVTDKVSYAKVLFASEINPIEYLDTAVMSDYPSAWIDVEQFGKYILYFRDKTTLPDRQSAYIIDYAYKEFFENAGFDIQAFGYSLVAYISNR